MLCSLAFSAPIAYDLEFEFLNGDSFLAVQVYVGHVNLLCS